MRPDPERRPWCHSAALNTVSLSDPQVSAQRLPHTHTKRYRKQCMQPNPISTSRCITLVGEGKKILRRQGGEDQYSNTPPSAPAASDVISHHRCRHQEDKWLPWREHGRVSERAMKAGREAAGTRAFPEAVPMPTLAGRL